MGRTRRSTTGPLNQVGQRAIACSPAWRSQVVEAREDGQLVAAVGGTVKVDPNFGRMAVWHPGAICDALFLHQLIAGG
jgi:hypothetical protein